MKGAEGRQPRGLMKLTAAACGTIAAALASSVAAFTAAHMLGTRMASGAISTHPAQVIQLFTIVTISLIAVIALAAAACLGAASARRLWMQRGTGPAMTDEE